MGVHPVVVFFCVWPVSANQVNWDTHGHTQYDGNAPRKTDDVAQLNELKTLVKPMARDPALFELDPKSFKVRPEVNEDFQSKAWFDPKGTKNKHINNAFTNAQLKAQQKIADATLTSISTHMANIASARHSLSENVAIYDKLVTKTRKGIWKTEKDTLAGLTTTLVSIEQAWAATENAITNIKLDYHGDVFKAQQAAFESAAKAGKTLGDSITKVQTKTFSTTKALIQAGKDAAVKFGGDTTAENSAIAKNERDGKTNILRTLEAARQARLTSHNKADATMNAIQGVMGTAAQVAIQNQKKKLDQIHAELTSKSGALVRAEHANKNLGKTWNQEETEEKLNQLTNSLATYNAVRTDLEKAGQATRMNNNIQTSNQKRNKIVVDHKASVTANKQKMVKALAHLVKKVKKTLKAETTKNNRFATTAINTFQQSVNGMLIADETADQKAKKASDSLSTGLSNALGALSIAVTKFVANCKTTAKALTAATKNAADQRDKQINSWTTENDRYTKLLKDTSAGLKATKDQKVDALETKQKNDRAKSEADYHAAHAALVKATNGGNAKLEKEESDLATKIANVADLERAYSKATADLKKKLAAQDKVLADLDKKEIGALAQFERKKEVLTALASADHYAALNEEGLAKNVGIGLMAFKKAKKFLKRAQWAWVRGYRSRTGIRKGMHTLFNSGQLTKLQQLIKQNADKFNTEWKTRHGIATTLDKAHKAHLKTLAATVQTAAEAATQTR